MHVKRKGVLETLYPVSFYCTLSILNLQRDGECSTEQCRCAMQWIYRTLSFCSSQVRIRYELKVVRSANPP